jgi:uncharacterized damage-inducible protein DinB
MSIINSILAEMEQEARTTTRVLERVPTEHLEWAPHAKSMTLRRLAWHVAFIPNRVEQMLRVNSFDLSQARPADPPNDTASIVDGFHKNMASVREYIAKLDPETLKEPFTLKRPNGTELTIPKIAVIRNILMNHTYHHRGQLSVYLRLLDVPVPAIYGTSADEP